ncbi:MAG: hypothetical protein RL095_3529 [Verrucomicrobiota bacterium]|jgi:DNA transformation protein
MHLAETLEDLLSPLGLIETRRMFGGAGMRCNGTFFAILDEDAVYFRGFSSRARHFFEVEQGLAPFEYTARGRLIRLRYFRIPLELLDEPRRLQEWTRLALEDENPQPKKRRPKS